MKNHLVSYLVANHPVYIPDNGKLVKHAITAMRISVNIIDKPTIKYKLKPVGSGEESETNWITGLMDMAWGSEDAYLNKTDRDLRIHTQNLIGMLRQPHAPYCINEINGNICMTGVQYEQGVIVDFQQSIGDTLDFYVDGSRYVYKPAHLSGHLYCCKEDALTVHDTVVVDENGEHIVKSPKTLLGLTEEQRCLIDSATALLAQARDLGVGFVYDDSTARIYPINTAGLNVEFEENYAQADCCMEGYAKVSDISLISDDIRPISPYYLSECYRLWVKPENNENNA